MSYDDCCSVRHVPQHSGSGRREHAQAVCQRYEPSRCWPKYGSVRFTSSASSRHHYSVAFPEWADKPIGFIDFLSAARFANSLANGKILTRTTSSRDGFKVYTYKVRLSQNTQTGMYDLNDARTTRTSGSGFVIPSQNEWIKAALFSPTGQGKYSYWEYPTGAV